MIYGIALAVLILLVIIALYNSLVRRKNDVENAFASIDAMLKKRYDLIPNLVDTVKSYMKHERKLLSELTELRAKAISTEISENERVVIFRGIFFVADFNKNFNGHTVVLPDTAERMLGKFGQSLQSMSSRGQLIRLEDPEFEKEFCVYSDDQVEARYILSTSLMQRIIEFKRKWNTKIYLSFRNSNVYIAISMSKNLFETRLFKSVQDYKFIEENIQFLILITGIIEDLNLNTRIWTKQ